MKPTEILTPQKLNELSPCHSGLAWYLKQHNCEIQAILLKLLDPAALHWDWFVWLMVRMMDQRQCVEWVLRSARLVMPVWEERLPDKSEARRVIEAAEEWLITGKYNDLYYHLAHNLYLSDMIDGKIAMFLGGILYVDAIINKLSYTNSTDSAIRLIASVMPYPQSIEAIGMEILFRQEN